MNVIQTITNRYMSTSTTLVDINLYRNEKVIKIHVDGDKSTTLEIYFGYATMLSTVCLQQSKEPPTLGGNIGTITLQHRNSNISVG